MTKISLNNSDVVISFRGNSKERTDNVYTTLKYFNATYSDYQVLLMEADVAPKFDWNFLADPKISHHSVYDNQPFPKSMLYNMAAKLSRSELLIFNDADCIANPYVMSHCVKDLLSSQAIDIWCPFNEMIDVKGTLKKQFCQELSYDVFAGIDGESLTDDCIYLSGMHTGGVNVCRRSSYIHYGGLNGKCRGWGPEDSEFHTRSVRLGMSWMSLKSPLFHLFHEQSARQNIGFSESVKADFAITDFGTIEEVEVLVKEMRQFFS